MRRHGFFGVAALAAGLVAMVLGVHPALAQFDALKGQTIRFIIAAPAGGSTDRTGRRFADLLGKLVPDATVRVQNLGEAAGGVGVAEVQNASGNVITFGMVNSGVVYAQLADTAPGQFDLGKLKWLGAVGGNLKVLMVRKGLGVSTLDGLAKLSKPPLIAVSGGAGTAGNTEALLIDAIGALRVRIVGDLEDAQISTLMLSGDIDGTIRSYATNKPLIDSGDAVPVMVYSHNGLPDSLGKVAALADVTPKGNDAVVQLITAVPRGMFMASPATKPDQLAALRSAFEKIVADPDFQSTLAAEDRAVKFTPGADLDRLLGGYFAAGSDFTARVAKLLACGARISGGEIAACP